jgi:hypothetical protein
MGVDNTDVRLKVANDKQGPSVLQDHHGREKVITPLISVTDEIHHFDHERIPARVVHALESRVGPILPRENRLRVRLNFRGGTILYGRMHTTCIE